MPTSTPRHLVVAINPSAAFGAKSAVGPRVAEQLREAGHEVEVLLAPDFSSLQRAARTAVAGRPDALIVIGGDGMVNLGVDLVAGGSVPLGLVPSGTGNDFARTLGIPHDDPEAATSALLKVLERPGSLAGVARRIDAARISWGGDPVLPPDAGGPGVRWFGCALSAGFDAIVNERANRMRRPKGPSRYILAMLAELVTLRALPYRLELDGEVIETRANLVSIGNGVSLGGGMKITPDALVDDGLLDVMVVAPLSRVNFLRIFPSVFRGTHVDHPAVTITRARRVRIESDGVIAYADGERCAPLPIDVELVPGSLGVLV